MNINNNSFKYFENRDCKYYPCHSMEHMNCLFCYCPLYPMEKCPGNYQIIVKNGKEIKSCVDCKYPHVEENYAEVIKILKTSNR